MRRKKIDEFAGWETGMVKKKSMSKKTETLRTCIKIHAFPLYVSLFQVVFFSLSIFYFIPFKNIIFQYAAIEYPICVFTRLHVCTGFVPILNSIEYVICILIKVAQPINYPTNRFQLGNLCNKCSYQQSNREKEVAK